MNIIATDMHSALPGDEVCPLCLARYAGVDESICTTCEAPSCPDCATAEPSTGDVLCFACHGPTKH